MSSFSGCSASVSLECIAWHTGRMASEPLAVDIARRSMYRVPWRPWDVASRQRLTSPGRISRDLLRYPLAARLWLRRGAAQQAVQKKCSNEPGGTRRREVAVGTLPTPEIVSRALLLWTLARPRNTHTHPKHPMPCAVVRSGALLLKHVPRRPSPSASAATTARNLRRAYSQQVPVVGGRVRPSHLRLNARVTRADTRAPGVSSSHSEMEKPKLFSAGVPLEALPWGGEGSKPVASRTFNYYEWGEGAVALEAYMAWDPAAAVGALPGVLVAHTAIGPQEEFIHSCCDALARMGYVALALDLFGAGECVFDRAERAAILDPLREDRTRVAARVQAAHDALVRQPECDASRGVAAIGFCLGGQAVLDLARAKTARGLRGVVSFHGSLDNPTTLPSPASPPLEPAVQALILHGNDDPFNPPERLAECMAGLDAAGIEFDVHVYSGAKHAFTRPAGPHAPSLFTSTQAITAVFCP